MSQSKPESQLEQLLKLLTSQPLAQKTLQWGPLTVSGVALANAIHQSDLLQSALSLVLSGASFAWGHYSKAYVEFFKQQLEERSQRDIQTLQMRLAALGYSAFEVEYLKWQDSVCVFDDIQGYEPENRIIPPLEDIFVSLELSRDFRSQLTEESFPIPMGACFEDFEQEIDRLGRLDIWEDFLSCVREDRRFRQISIRALGGFGKTTLLRNITATYTKGKFGKYKASKLVPFLIYLRQWGEFLATEEAPDLPEFLRDRHIKAKAKASLRLDEVPEGWVEKVLEGEALVMFDGFDEVPEGEKRQAVSRWLARQMEAYPKSTFIVSSRPAAYEDFVGQPRPRTALFVKPFNREQIREFVHKWYRVQETAQRSQNVEHSEAIAAIAATERAEALLAQIESQAELAEMASNPLLLNLIAVYHRFYQARELPWRRSKLYESIFILQLRDRPNARDIDMLVEFPDSQKILQEVALTMVRQQKTRIGRADLLELLSRGLQARELDVKPEAFLKKIIRVSELLVEKEREEYDFSHLSFQEYLAAAEVSDRQLEEELLENYQEAKWQGTIILYGALVNPNRLLRALLEIGTPEAAELAYKCLQETPRKVDDALREQLSPRDVEELEETSEQVRQVRFQKLEELLSSGEWREADEETYRIMIRTVGKDEGQLFERKDLENFPCEELRELDRLWVRNSNGKWGFSVQKRIWIECGSPTTYNDDWEKFGERVGWRRRETFEARGWIFSLAEDFLYDPSSSVSGHLPLRLSSLCGTHCGARYSSLFSRAESCEL